MYGRRAAEGYRLHVMGAVAQRTVVMLENVVYLENTTSI
jgi:hypothetical protein